MLDLKPTKFGSHRQNLPQTKAEKTIVDNSPTEILIILQLTLATVVVILVEDYVSTKTGTRKGTSVCHGYSYIQMETVWLITTQTQPFRCCQINVKASAT